MIEKAVPARDAQPSLAPDADSSSNQRRPHLVSATLCAVWALACAGSADLDLTNVSEDDFSRSRYSGDNYLRRVAAVDQNTNDTYILHWPERKMPLRVYLPPPPAGLFEDPDAVAGAVRRGIVDWSDVVSVGVPGFVFVDAHGDADIPVVWAEEPDGDWYIAFCSYQAGFRPLRFGVEQILVSGRWRAGHVASVEEIYDVMLHEMGHALGLMGHSDDPGDVMFPSVSGRSGAGLSERDRRTLRDVYAHGNRQIRGRRGRNY